MQRKQKGARIYTVVDVMGGVAVGARSFVRLEDARACLRRLRLGRDLGKDDVRLFEGTVHWHPGVAPRSPFAEAKASEMIRPGRRVRSPA